MHTENVGTVFVRTHPGTLAIPSGGGGYRFHSRATVNLSFKSASSMPDRWMPYWNGGRTSPNHDSFSRSFAFILSLTTAKLIIEPNELTRCAVRRGKKAKKKNIRLICAERENRIWWGNKREVRATCSSCNVSNCKWNEFCMTDEYYMFSRKAIYYCSAESNAGSITHANAAQMLLFPAAVHLHDAATFRRCLSTSRISMRTFVFYSIRDTEYAFTMQKRQV